MKPRTPIEEEVGQSGIVRCGKCGSDNIQVRVWVKANTFPVKIAYHDWAEEGVSCMDCKESHSVKEVENEA